MKHYERLALIPFFILTCPVFAQQNPVDLIVYGDYVVTMDAAASGSLINKSLADKHGVIRNGAVAITGINITAVGSRDDINRRFHARVTIDGKDRILMPGLVNGHNHSAMVLFRGMADDLELIPWLTNFVFPLEARFVTPEFIATGTRLACWEMIRGGTTTFVDMYFYPGTIAKVIDECGLRAVIASPSIDAPSPGFKGWDDSFAAAVNFIKHWQHKNERITPAFGPHAPYTVSPEHIRQVADKARELNAPVTMHLAEAATEVADILSRYENTPVKHVATLGLLDISLIAAHMVHPSDAEIALLARKNVGVIHNPTSNLKLAVGIAPVVKMLAAGVQVGLGTDGAASNNDLDMWEEIHLAALIHKNANRDPTVVPSITALKMATSMGAAAIGLGDLTGVLEAGKRADMIQININSPGLTPLYDVVSQLVYAVDSDDVITTIVSGKVLMENAKVLTLDADEVRAQALASTREIARILSGESL